jgi:hypothetical protein
MTRPHPAASTAWFLVKFAIAAAGLLVIWWIVQPRYVWFIGQIAGAGIVYAGGIPVDRMLVEVDDSGVLNTRTSLVYVHDGRRYPIDVAFLIANLPGYLALVLATGRLGWKRRLRALVYGAGILIAGHVIFLVVVFVFAREVQAAPEIPTAFGLFVMTLPFLLWIVFAYWERVAEFFAPPSASGDGAAASEDSHPAD